MPFGIAWLGEGEGAPGVFGVFIDGRTWSGAGWSILILSGTRDVVGVAMFASVEVDELEVKIR